MAADFKRYLRLLRTYARLDLQFVRRDKRMGLITIFCDWLSTLSSLSGLALMAVRFDGIAGLTADEILWMLGFFTMADGLTVMLMGGYNFLHISRVVGRGQVDHMLIQPCPLWMQLLSGGFMPFSGNSGFLAGAILLVVATARLRIAVTPAWILLLLIYALARLAVAAGISYLAGAAAFYRPVSCEELSTVVLEALNTAGRYPWGMLPTALRILLSTLLPVSLLAYLPSLLLLGKLHHPAALVWPVALGAGLTAAAATAFRKGLKHYVRSGCPRYKRMGHRC